MGKYSELLSDAIKSMIEVKEERDLDSLFLRRAHHGADPHHRRAR